MQRDENSNGVVLQMLMWKTLQDILLTEKSRTLNRAQIIISFVYKEYTHEMEFIF